MYPHQIAFNVLPQVETFKDGDDYTTEERKCMRETSKILGRDDIDFPKYTHCAKGNVFEIADGSGNDIENAGHRTARDMVSLCNDASGYSWDLMMRVEPRSRDLGKLT